MTTEPEEQQQPTTLARISEARHALAEAKTLNDFRKVMEVAAVATDAAKRAAGLMKAQGMASEIVQQAAEAANDAAAVRIEAQASAGQILREMPKNKGGGDHRLHSVSGEPPTLEEIGVKPIQSHRWQKIADIPSEVRSAYVRKTVADDGWITDKGLIRFAADPKPLKEDRTTVEDAYNEVCRLVDALTKFNAQAIAAHASGTRSKSRFRDRLSRLQEWANRADGVLR